MTALEVIDLISTSTKSPLNPSNYKDQFREWAMLIHPDKCTIPKAKEAFDRLTSYKNEIENGIEFSDEISTITMKGNVLYFSGPMDKLIASYENYKSISLSMDSHSSFKYYLPESMTLMSDGLEVRLRDNINGNFHHSVRLNGLTLAERHVKWFLNRCLEFTSMLNCTSGYTHCGIGPNSVLICPETHGIQVISFYHTVKHGDKLKSLNGMVKNWYPVSVFSDKIAIDSIDLELCKRYACTLLGDLSGLGTKLKGTIDDEFVTFLLTSHVDIREGYLKYQDFLNKSPRTFHKLDL